MRKLYFLILLLTGFTGFAFSPPVINNPEPIRICDQNGDGTEVVDLTLVIPQVLGALNPSLYTVTFHNSFAAAAGGVAPIIPINSYVVANNQVVFIRVEENADTANFSTAPLEILLTFLPTAAINGYTTICGGEEVTVAFQGTFGTEPYTFTYTVNNGPVLTVVTPFTLNGVGVNLPSIASGTYDILLISVQSSEGCVNTINVPHHIDVVPVPTPLQPLDLSIEQIPYVGTAVFDLTSNDALLFNGDPNLTVSYFTSLMNAEANTGVIVAPSAYVGTNGQRIWVNIRNESECSVIKSFVLYTTNPDIVFIPDANFKARLLSANSANHTAFTFFNGTGSYSQVDLNGDGEIQFTEAVNVLELNLNSQVDAKISDLTGIEAFTQVSNLDCSYNLLTTLNITPLINNSMFWRLDCSNNNLSTFNYNSLGNISYLNCSSNNLSSLSINNLTNLTTLSCAYNQLTELDIEAFHLNYLDCSHNQIPVLDFGFPLEMTHLDIMDNLITALDVTTFPNLTELFCSGNSMDTLDFSNVNLWRLTCGPVLNPINVENQTNLRYFLFWDTEQENLNLLNNTLLDTVSFQNVNVSSLDFSNCGFLADLDIINSQNLEYLNLKGGRTWFGNVGNSYSYAIKISQCPNLDFVCSDEQNIVKVKQALAYYINNPAVAVSSYCTFTPGGNYNTITGTLTFDVNNNGCDSSDIVEPNIRVNINDTINSGASFTNETGNYTFYTQAGNFSINASVENPAWFNFSPSSVTVPFANNNNNVVTQNFCITPNGIHSDVEVVIAPVAPARPGFDAVYKIVYKNKGNQTVSGNVSFAYDGEVLNFVSSNVIPTSQSTGLLNYNYSNLLPFENRSVIITLHVNAPTDNPAITIGDELDFTAIVNPIAGDQNAADNTFGFHQTVVGSFDPNNVVCIEGDLVSPLEIGNYLHYIINFENTGTADAENIVVRDVIDTTQFDVNSLQLLNSSAPVTAKLTGNVAEFIFPNINLHSGGHGNILIKVRSRNTLVTGDSVSKRANIFFDYNLPVETLPENTLFQSLSNPDIPVDASISVYPNPTKGTVNINCSNTIQSVQLYDIQGRILQTNLVNENQAVLDISNQSNGVYFLKIISDKGMGVKKIVRE
jgi:uncharacterized repeat protein (TIGR01451 family)